jgi:hypothetical protein
MTMAGLLSSMCYPLVDDDNCSRGSASPFDIVPPRECDECGVVIPIERIASVPNTTKCVKCQVDNDQEEFYVMESAATGSEGKTSRVPVRMPRSEYKKIKRPGYGSNLRFDRK